MNLSLEISGTKIFVEDTKVGTSKTKVVGSPFSLTVECLFFLSIDNLLNFL
nr:12606_t:CDS:2 [Entrophospora candida]